MRVRACITVWASLAAAGALWSCAEEGGPSAQAPEPICQCEVRSWVVAGRGRHLLAEITCPPGFESFEGVVEFTSSALREDWPGPGAPALVARMTPGVRLRPMFGAPREERVEAVFQITPDQAACIQRDRVYETPYALLGPNSNSGLRAAMESCGLALPAHVLERGGPLDEFPGVWTPIGGETLRQR